jgi:hypothetical protein
MAEQTSKPYGLGRNRPANARRREPGLHLAGAAASLSSAAEPHWRVSGDERRRRSALPHLGPVLLAIVIVALMALGLHVLFV